MERFGLVMVAAFAAGMFCGPLFCVIYSRSRRRRKLKPGLRQLKNARRQLVSVAEHSGRLGAQRWEMAMGAAQRRRSTTIGDDRDEPQPGPRPQGGAPAGPGAAAAASSSGAIGGSAGGEDSIGGRLRRPPCGAGDDEDDNDCPICIGPLFPRRVPEDGPGTRTSASYACSTQACIDQGDGTGMADGGRGHGVPAAWRAWALSLRRRLGFALSSVSSSTPPSRDHPEMASSAGHGLIGTHSLLPGRRWGGQQGGGAAGDGVQSDAPSRPQHHHVTVREDNDDNGNDTPDSRGENPGQTSVDYYDGGGLVTNPAGASPPVGSVGAAAPAGATGVSQGGNVLEGVHDSSAKAMMTPVNECLAADGTTGSLSPAPASSAGDDKAGRRLAQPPTGVAGHSGPPTSGLQDDAAALSPPRSSSTTSQGSTEGGRGEPSISPPHPSAASSTPRRPANAIVRASRRATATVLDGLSPSRRVRRASLMQQQQQQQHRRRGRWWQSNDDDDDDNNINGSGGTGRGDDDLDTEILVLQGCRHAFHARCLVMWFLADGFDCPVCRAPYWMRRERMARALQNERNGLPLDHGQELLQARQPAAGYWAAAGIASYSAIGGTIVVVRAPPRSAFPTDRRAWEVYLP